MSSTGIEWIAPVLFLLLLVCSVVAEIIWLVRKSWAESGKAIAYVMVSDLLGFGLGAGVVFAVFMALFMMTMGPAGRGGTAPEGAYWIVSIAGLIIPPILLFVFKRIFLAVFKIRTGKDAWLYSLAVTFITFLVVFIPPPVLFFVIGYLSTWK